MFEYSWMAGQLAASQGLRVIELVMVREGNHGYLTTVKLVTTGTVRMLLVGKATMVKDFEMYVRTQKVLGRNNQPLSFDTTCTVQKTTRPTIVLLLCVFVAAGTCLPRRCVATIGGYKYRETYWWNLWSKKLRQAQAPWHAYQVS
jgi:hypothetical protein